MERTDVMEGLRAVEVLAQDEYRQSLGEVLAEGTGTEAAARVGRLIG